MRELIGSLYAGDENYDLYLGVIEAVEGIIREFPEDAWKRKMIGDPELDKQVQETVYGAGLMGLGVDQQYNGMGGGLLGQILVTDMLAQAGLTSFASVLTSFCRAPLLNHGTPAQIEQYAVPSISGEKAFCILATEPDAGTNTFNISTRAVKRGVK